MEEEAKVTKIVSDKPNSIEVSKLAKGGYTWNAKIYFNSGDEETTLLRIKKLEADLKLEYGDKE